MIYCMCENCGNKAVVDTSVVLTTYPPQYSYSCPTCGHKGYLVCYDAKDDAGFDLADKIERLTIELKDLRREVEELQNKLAKEGKMNKQKIEIEN